MGVEGTTIPPDAGFEVYRGDDEQHYWRLRASNGQIVATGGEGFSSKGAAIRAVGAVKRVIGEQLAFEAEVRAGSEAAEVETSGSP